MTKVKEAGSVGKYTMSMGWERGYMVSPTYGKSGGTRTDIAMTNAILQSIQREMGGDPYGPKIILGDFNHTPNLLATVKDLMKEQQWIDVGSVADWWEESQMNRHAAAWKKHMSRESMDTLRTLKPWGRYMITRWKNMR